MCDLIVFYSRERPSKMTLIFYRMLLLLLAGSVSFAHSQPVSCTEDVQCQENYFCEPFTFACIECIECEQYKRVTLIKPSSGCSKSITDCGTCVTGYTENKGVCIPYETKPLSPTSNYKMYLIVCVVVLLIVVIVIAVIVCKKKPFRLFNLSHMTLVECNHNGLQKVSPPDESPPSYSLYPTPTAPAAPAATEGLDTGSSWPLLNRYGPFSQSTRRETVGDQRASVNNPPAYIRNSEIGLEENVLPAVNDDDIPPTAYEEDETRDSNWTPGDTNTNTNNNITVELPMVPVAGEPSLSTQLAAARGTQLLHVGRNAPSLQLALLNIPSASQETDDNGNQEESRQSGTASRNNISVNQIFNFH